MVCSFCGDPAASDATGCRYGASTLACRACVVSFWAWVKQHTNGKARRSRGGAAVPSVSFYEAAGKRFTA